MHCTCGNKDSSIHLIRHCISTCVAPENTVGNIYCSRIAIQGTAIFGGCRSVDISRSVVAKGRVYDIRRSCIMVISTTIITIHRGSVSAESPINQVKSTCEMVNGTTMLCRSIAHKQCIRNGRFSVGCIIESTTGCCCSIVLEHDILHVQGGSNMVHSSTLTTFITNEFYVFKSSCSIVVKSTTQLHYSIIFKDNVAKGSCSTIEDSAPTIISIVVFNP
ncbi:hypothetical protein D3C86_1069260 [compost metagenome]